MILPSCKAFCRMARCGESGFALSTFAFCQKGASDRSLAQASAPMKLGILPLAPGKRATFFFCSSSQISSRMASFVFILRNRKSRFYKRQQDYHWRLIDCAGEAVVISLIHERIHYCLRDGGIAGGGRTTRLLPRGRPIGGVCKSHPRHPIRL